MSDKEKSKQEIKLLIDKYNKIVESGRVKSYNEEMTKKDFILPLFRALGWSVEDGEEVTAEEKISKGRVDYAFRISGIPKLFLEAKSLREDLEKIEFAEQAINYAWHKGATWAILTDFEGIKVFNAEWKSANPLQNLFFGLHCNQFLDRFDQLWLLSRESLEKGWIDTEAEKWGKKAKKVPVDKQLLSDLTRFRELLTKNILKNNASKNLSAEELDEAVQRILDRLIFIRTLEDRRLEAPILQSLVREDHNKRLYKKLNASFRQIDDIYNSKLFSFHLCEELNIDDDVLEKIIIGLFKTSDETVHYDFGAIDADVLGNMYEQYLGYLLHKTDKRATFSEGKAHRKEQGIYYTPTYVVDYIVRNTIGEIAKDKKFDLKNIKVLDPACGSGSFLMKAFDYLVTLDKKRNEDVDQLRLDVTGASATYGRKVEILKNNIYGVDLDQKAVEIAQLNLLLKAAEKKHRLPTLQENIKVGNSLIDDQSIAGDKVFKWEEQFKDITDKGGFDVVIGNPPYVNMQTLPELQKYCVLRYPEIYTGQNDILYYFVCKGLNIIGENGRLGFIISRYFLESKYASKFRRFMLDKAAISLIIDFNNFQVFGRDVNVLTSIILLKKKSKSQKEQNIKVIKIKEWLGNGLELINIINSKQNKKNYSDDNLDIFEISQSELDEESWYLSNPKNSKLKEKIVKSSTLLGEICDIGKGMETGLNEAYVLSLVESKDKHIEQELLRNYVKTRDLKRYVPLDRSLRIIYIPQKLDINKYVNSIKHLEKWESQLKQRYDYKKKHCEWYSWGNLRNRELFEKKVEKIITPLYSTTNKFVYDSGEDAQHFFTLTDTYIIVNKSTSKISLKYILALLNSQLMEFFFKNTSKLKREGYYEYSGGTLSHLPIKHNGSLENEIIKFVDMIIYNQRKLYTLKDKSTDEKFRLENEIKKLDKEIDELVYKLYGITKEEQKTIEESLK